MYTIYALIDPRDYTVHYVGQTTDVYQRFTQHINGEGSSFIKNAWIFELRALNRMIIMETLEETDTYQSALEREAYWIRHFEMLSEPLSNATHRAALKKVKKDQIKASRQVVYQVMAAMEVRSVPEVIIPPPERKPITDKVEEIGDMFYVQQMSMSAIVKRLYPGVTGGEKYQRATREINEAIRKYIQRGA